MIGVIIHEVGQLLPDDHQLHGRQWTWMDEGLNTFVQFLTEKEFDRAHRVEAAPATFESTWEGTKRGLAPS